MAGILQLTNHALLVGGEHVGDDLPHAHTSGDGMRRKLVVAREPVSYTHLDVYKRQHQGPKEGTMTPNESIAFTHATILDGTANMAPQQDMTVVVDRGVIARVGKASRVDVPAGDLYKRQR